MDLLDHIDNLQAYLEQMKDKISRGEISEPETHNALQNISLVKKTDAVKGASPKRRKSSSKRTAKVSEPDGRTGDTKQYGSVEEIEKEMERRVENMRQLLTGAPKSDENEKASVVQRKFLKTIQMRRSTKFQCTECNRTFVHVDKAEKHVKEEHLDEGDVKQTASSPSKKIKERKKDVVIKQENDDNLEKVVKSKRKIRSDEKPGGQASHKKVKIEPKRKPDSKDTDDNKSIERKENTSGGSKGLGKIETGPEGNLSPSLEEEHNKTETTKEIETAVEAESNTETATNDEIKTTNEVDINEAEKLQADDETEVVFNITFDKEPQAIDFRSPEEITTDSLVEEKTCAKCNMVFTYGFQRRQHMSSYHWGCHACRVQFLHEQPFETHQKECKHSQGQQKGPFLIMKLRRNYEGENDFFKYVVVKFTEVDKKKQVKMECLICGKEYFGQLAKMMRHVKSVHTKECDYMCDTCSKPFADKDNLVKHIQKCKGKPWVPKKRLYDTDLFPTVMESAPDEDDTTYACTTCLETFNTDYQFREHMSTVHWGCGTCLWQFLDESTFQDHISTCEDFKSPEDSDITLPETDLIQFKEDRLFYKYVKMRVLYANSGKKRTFECAHEHCKSSEHDHLALVQLKKHIMYRHETKELKYQCEKCGTGFVDKFSLWKHSGSKCNEGKEKIVISKLLSRIKPTTGDDASKDDAVIVKKECIKCEAAFLYDYNYREHMAVKHWVCKPCKLQFLSDIVYEKHRENCNKKFHGAGLSIPKVHLNLYKSDQKFFDFAQINFACKSRRLYQCTECGDHDHRNLVKLKRHITCKHTKELTEKCVICEKGFRDKRALLKHCYDHLKSGQAVLEVEEDEVGVYLSCIEEYVAKYTDVLAGTTPKSYVRKLQCLEGCSITFSDPIARLTHMAEIHYRCQYCKMAFQSRAYQTAHELVCEKSENTSVDNPNEGQSVKAVKPLNHRSRESLNFMTEHGISYEDGRLNCYGCQRCGKAFKDIAKIKRHVLGHHLKVSEHVCNTCGKGFYEKKALTSHEKVHRSQGERGHISCEICGCKLLADVPNSLKNHMTKHTGERPFLCHLCPMSFRSKNTLQTHLSGVHFLKKDFSCTFCTFSCGTKGRLQSHVRIHTGEKPYACDTCGESFRERGALRNHKMIHSGYRTVQCDECGQGFIKKVDYITHMLTHNVQVLDNDPKVQSFIPQTHPIEIQPIEAGTTYQIVNSVEDEVQVEVVTDSGAVEPGTEYETVRIINGDQVTESAYIIMISEDDNIAYTYDGQQQLVVEKP